mmetsp:Transcript_24925/g.41553  ORF Transcript_24925/g.41553 Transcript_24925/m.41553 type:complete len:316 (-) Transcript_24925:182-1129(-)
MSETTATTVENQDPTVPKEIETYLSKLEGSPKPWFLSSTMIYQWAKAAGSNVPNGQIVFEQSIHGITALTVFINEKTKANVLVLDMEKANDLITQLDGLLSDQFIMVDDGFDSLRGKLGSSLRKLISSLVQNKQLALDFIVKKGDDLREAGETATKTVATRYEQVLEVMKSIILSAKEKYPELSGNIEAKAEVVKTVSVDYYNKIFDASVLLLKTAQPYVHTAVERATPYVVNAVEVSQPYVVQAKPYLEPLVAKAQDVNVALQENKVVGAYVSRAEQLVVDTCTKALEEAKTYCIAPPPAADVAPGASAVDEAD